jgi:hypothetical protein
MPASGLSDATPFLGPVTIARKSLSRASLGHENARGGTTSTMCSPGQAPGRAVTVLRRRRAPASDEMKMT